MAKHSTEEMEALSLDELKKNAVVEAATAPVVGAAIIEALAPKLEAKTEEDEPEEFLARREVDLGDGAGLQVFEGKGATREEALEALADKQADAQLHATRKIREQATRLKEFEAREAGKQKSAELSQDDEYVISQQLQKTPGKLIDERAEKAAERALEKREAEHRAKEANAEQQKIAIEDFLASHSDYIEEGVKGKKNGKLMNAEIIQLGLPVTSENLHKAYSQLKQGGFLELKGEEANADTDDKAKEPERIAQAKVEATQQRTKKASGISTQSSRTAAPANTEPSEDDAYNMPLDKLKQLANKQMSAR